MKSKQIIILLSLIVFSTINFSQTINDALRLVAPNSTFNARSMGMGNAYIGLSDDAAASYFNPAGLGLIKKMEITGGLDYYSIKNKSLFFNNVTDYNNSSTQLSNIGFVFPFPTLRGSFALGVFYSGTKNFTKALKFDGFNPLNNSLIQSLLDTDLPYDLYLTDSNGNTIINGNLNQSGLIIESGSINNWALTSSLEIYKNLLVGGTLNITSGDYKYSRDFYEDDINNIYKTELSPTDPFTKDFKTFYMNSLLNWEISGWDLKIGMLYQINNRARVGLTLQFPKSYKIKEKFAVDAQSIFAAKSIYLDKEKYEDAVEYDIISPFVFTGGGSINLKGIIVSAEASLVDYSQTKFDNPVGISDQFVAKRNSQIKNYLRAVVNFNLGAEYTIPNINLRIRGGYFVQPTPFKNYTSEYNKKYITGGVGILLDETISVDFAYVRGNWKQFTDNYYEDYKFGTNYSRIEEEITLNQLIFSFSYRF